MRVATIDIGTNTVLLLVAERDSGGSLRAVTERATITRLGAGVDQRRRLDADAVARTCSCLAGYARVVEEFAVDRIALVGTSAMRDASGGETLRAFVRDTFAVDARILSGAEEARFTFSGAMSGLTVEVGGDVAVFDIGGGSTEVALGQPHDGSPSLSYVESFDVGSVRMTERHITHDPPTVDERDVLFRTARAAFANVPRLPAYLEPVGVAGTMTTLAAVALGMAPYDGARLHGASIRCDKLREVVDQLALLDVATRRQVPGMEPLRADVIVAGGFIALALLSHWQVDTVRISDRGVRWGLAEELARD